MWQQVANWLCDKPLDEIICGICSAFRFITRTKDERLAYVTTSQDRFYRRSSAVRERDEENAIENVQYIQ